MVNHHQYHYHSFHGWNWLTASYAGLWVPALEGNWNSDWQDLPLMPVLRAVSIGWPVQLFLCTKLTTLQGTLNDSFILLYWVVWPDQSTLLHCCQKRFQVVCSGGDCASYKIIGLMFPVGNLEQFSSAFFILYQQVESLSPNVRAE